MTRPQLPERIRTRHDVDALLAAATNYEERMPRTGDRRTFDLRRMSELLAAVGQPQRGIRTTHVAGSKGKGSVARLLAHTLREAAGARVGLFTSPHLEDLAERIDIDGRPIHEDAFAAAADKALPAVRAAQDSALRPTFYEIMTVIAWLAFRAAGCDDVVLETGLGGRLDATNVCQPTLCIITSIELEHTRLLGDTLEAIAGEKAGIIKPGVPVVTSAREPALGVIRTRAKALDAPCHVLGEDFDVGDVRAHEGPRLEAVFESAGTSTPLTLPIAGHHQAQNAAVAFRGALTLGMAPRAIAAALRTARLPGTLEVVARHPAVIVDGAHTPGSARAAARALAAWWPDTDPVLLLAMLGGKDVAGVLEPLLAMGRRVITTQVDSPRAVPADVLAEAARAAGATDVRVVADPATALQQARDAAGPDGLVLATGSVYLAGAVRTASLRAQG